MVETTNHASPIVSAGSWLTRQNALGLLLLLGTLLAFSLCFLMVRPFLAPMAWALALAIVAHPIHHWLKARLGYADLSALLALVIVAIILITPATFVVHQLLREAAANIDLIQAPEEQETWRSTLENSPLGDWFIWVDERFDVAAHFTQLINQVAGAVTGVVGASVWTIVQMMVMLFTLYFLFRDRRQLLDALRSLVPLSQAEADEVFRLVGETIHATVYGSVMMAMIQGALGGLIFWLLGLPSPILWGVVMAVLATVPNLGAFVIWVPTVFALVLQDQLGKAAILAAWGLIAIGLIDNLLYPIVVGTRMRMHTLLVFFAILGGILVFGPAGLILGPVVFALTHALIDIWRRRTRDGKAAECGVAPAATGAPLLHKETPATILQEAVGAGRDGPR